MMNQRMNPPHRNRLRRQGQEWTDTHLDGEVGYGLPVGNSFVGTPRVGFSTSECGSPCSVPRLLMRRPRRLWRVIELSSFAAMFSQLPCFGVWQVPGSRRRPGRRRAEDAKGVGHGRRATPSAAALASSRTHSRNAWTSGRCREAAVVMRQQSSGASA